MRRVIAVLLLLVVIPANAEAHAVGSPIYVSFLLDRFVTPDVAPGESGQFSFVFTNTYPWQMRNVSLRLEIHRFRDVDVDIAVNDSAWTGPGPYFQDQALGLHYFIEPFVPTPLDSRGSVNVSFPVVTYAETPHGSLTKQASYFVRARLEFELTDGVTTNRSTMMSRGYFTNEQLLQAEVPCGIPCPPSVYYAGLLNLTYLGSLYGLNHIDGMIPDSVFSVKDRMPLWPYIVAGGGVVVSLAFALLYYAEENPGKYPRLARWWLGMKGKARGVRRPKPR